MIRVALGRFGVTLALGIIPVQFRYFRNKEQKRVWKAKEDR